MKRKAKPMKGEWKSEGISIYRYDSIGWALAVNAATADDAVQLCETHNRQLRAAMREGEK
jgi:hypothetical protein